MRQENACAGDIQEEAPGNKVLLAVSRSFGGCSQCGMLFPDRSKCGTPYRRFSKGRPRPDEMENRLAPAGVYHDDSDSEGRTWYHVPNFGRKFFDALRKYYTVRENGREIRVAIKRPEKDSYCTWIGIVGHPRHYSTGGKRSKMLDDKITTPIAEPVSRFRVGSASTVNTEQTEEADEVPSSRSDTPNTATNSWVNSSASMASSLFLNSPAGDEFASPTESDSPLTRSCLRNKNACLKFNALDWFPEDSVLGF